MKNKLILQSVVDEANPKKFAPWVRALYGKNGVYAIFSKQGREFIAEYVGVSSAEKLYGTLTRHFQQWDRNNGGQMTGPVFDRRRVMVAIEIIPNKFEALEREQEWIAMLEPVLNQKIEIALDGEEADESEPDDVEPDVFDELADFFG